MEHLLNGAKIRSSSWRNLSGVIGHLDDRARIFRHRTTICVKRSVWNIDEKGVAHLVSKAEYINERTFTYWAERLVMWGLCEKASHERGWYKWTTYRLKQSYGDTMNILGGIPF